MQITLHIVFGPTGSGKSKLAQALSDKFHYPILSVDSRKVYQKADIGTNKYSTIEYIKQNPSILVGGIDIISPEEKITAYKYQQYVYKWLEENKSLVSKSGGLILHGGTGLYLDAILKGMSLQSEANKNLRNEFLGMSVKELQNYALKVASKKFNNLNDSDRNNPRRLQRLIENSKEGNVREGVIIPELIKESKQVWYLPFTDRKVLYQAINDRVEKYFELGWFQEVATLKQDYGEDNCALQMMGYKQVFAFMKANSDWKQQYSEESPAFQELVQEIQKEHRKYAKRQETWGKRYIYH